MTRDNLFVAVERSYAAGMEKTPPAIPQDLNDIESLLSGLPHADAVRIHTSTGYYQQALKAARNGEIAQAEKFFRIVLRMLPFEQMARQSRLVARNLIKPVESYIRYKQNDYQQARALMEEALLCTNALRDEFGYQAMDARRVHLARNLMRLESRLGDIHNAARMGFKLLHYVEGDGRSWPLANLAAETNDVRIPAHLRTPAFNQVAWELVLLFANGGEADQAVVLEEGNRAAAQSEVDQSRRIETLTRWVHAKKALVGIDHTGFLVQASLFFPDGRGTFPLWLALSADTCHVCDESGSGQARSLRTTITGDIGALEKFQQLMSPRGQS